MRNLKKLLATMFVSALVLVSVDSFAQDAVQTKAKAPVAPTGKIVVKEGKMLSMKRNYNNKIATKTPVATSAKTDVKKMTALEQEQMDVQQRALMTKKALIRKAIAQETNADRKTFYMQKLNELDKK